MELIELLEERVRIVLAEISRLRNENQSLREELKAARAAVDAGRKAYRDLETLKKNNEEAARRLQSIADEIQGTLKSL